ncbi:MAG: Ig-like domain-containing protein [Bacteroidota bacterium]
MDISLQKLKLLFILLFALPILGQAQAGLSQEKTAFKNTPLKIWAQDVSSQGLVLVTNPKHGRVIDNIAGENGVDTLVYLPNQDFIGVDEFTFEHFTDYPPLVRVGPVKTTAKITIVPSYVEAQHDYSVIEAGKTVSLRVITNDSVTHGALSIDPIFPVVNHGTVMVGAERGFVNFTPEDNFTGLADFNYIACDSIGTCATGAVTVYVNPKGATFNDAIRLGTGQNTDKAIPMPFKVTRVEPATNVKIEKSQYAVVYQPQYDFYGQETFTVYGADGNQRTVTIDVIERPINALSLANEDVVYATLGESVDVNLLANDDFTGISRVEVLSVQGGSISNQANLLDGNITFTPDEGFSGVARIWYLVFDSGYEKHLGNAYVVYDRNNFGPNTKDFEYTFRVNPGQTKIIDYKAPIDSYRLSPTAGFDNLLGFVSANTNKSIIYEAPEEGPARDEFEVSYCAPANSDNCQQIKIRIEVVEELVEDCSNDCVFPGDLNNDGIVNSTDLLPLGLHIGTKGPARNDQSTNFKAREADAWNMSFVEEDNPVNLKHYDANGDGVITEQDAEPIIANYGAVRQLVPSALPALSKGISITPNRVSPSTSDIPVGQPIPAGSRVEFAINLGDEDAQELDLYGFTFPFKLSGKSFIDESSFAVTFNDDSWAALNAPTIDLAQNVSEENSNEIAFDLAFTRTSGKPVSGIGPVATVSFVVIGDVVGFKLPDNIATLNIQIGDGYAIDGQGKYYEYDAAQEIELPVTFERVEEEELRPSSVVVFPNPVSDQLSVHLNSFNYEVKHISLFNMTGQEVFRSVPLATKQYPISVANLAEGLYILSVQTDGGTISKKVEVLRR